MSVFRTYVQLFRRNPALARLLAGEFVSGIGDWLYLVAILVVIYAETESAALLGIVGAARILPYVLLSYPAGIVVDRYDRRMVLLVTDLARGALMVILAALALFDASVWAIVALAILAACFSTFFGPAISALLPNLVDESDLGPANSAWATLDNLAFIIGPALAGILIAVGGLSIAFLLNAASFAIVAAVLWRLPVTAGRPSGREDVAKETGTGGARRVGWRELVGPLSGPFVLDSVTSFIGGGIGILTVVIAIDVLGAGEAGTGYLNAATGAGGVVAGVVAGALLARRLRVPLLIGGVVAGLGLVWLGVVTDLATGMIAIAVAVAGVLLLEVVNTTLIQRIVPDEVRGRAVGVLQTTSAILYSAGSLVLPVLAATLGVTVVLVGSGVAIVAGVLLALVLSERLAHPIVLDPARARLLELPIFAGLAVPRLEAAARSVHGRAVTPGEVVIRQGDRADRFYVVGDGRFEVTQVSTDGGRSVPLRELGPDDVFGEIGLLERTPRTATVTALTAGQLLTMEGETFLELVSAGPGLSTRLLDLYRGALSRTG